MYAIIATGGRQYKVFEGQELQIDYRADVAPGDAVAFDRVVAHSDGSKSEALARRSSEVLR